MQGLLTLQPIVCASKAARRRSSTATSACLLEKAWDEKPPQAPLFQVRVSRVPVTQLAMSSNLPIQTRTIISKQTSTDPRLSEGEAMTERICSNYSSNIDEEPALVSLAAMVHGFMEDNCEIGKCGRARCNCGDGTIDKAECLLDIRDGERSRIRENLRDALEALISSIHGAEQALLDTICLLMRKVEKKPDPTCVCGVTNRSNGCLRLFIMQELRRLGYNTAICKSKWDPTAGYPGGVYEYLDVITGNTVSNQKQERVIIDVEFLGHFEIARPTRPYRAMLNMLPPIFVGRPDSLQQIVNLMCEAAKISLNERQLHVPPWRKCEYMQAKWFSSNTRISNESDHLHGTGKGHEQNDSRVLAARELNMEPRLIVESEVTLGQAEPKSARRELRKSESDRCGKWLGHRFEEYGVKRPSRVANKMLAVRDELTVVSTDWQPPSVQPKTCQRFRKVAGLAAVLGQAEASIQKSEENHLASAKALPKQCHEDLRLPAEMQSKTKPRNMHTKRTWIYANVDLTQGL